MSIYQMSGQVWVQIVQFGFQVLSQFYQVYITVLL